MRKKFIPGAVVALAICASAAVPASAANGAGTVRGSSVNFRAAASTDSAVKAVTYDGAPVVLESRSGDWYEVVFNGSLGYINAQYLDCADCLEAPFGTAYVNGTDVRLRSSPSTASSIVGTYSYGVSLTVVSVYGSWYGVCVDGAYGYMSSDYVSFAKPLVSPRQNPQPVVSAGQRIADIAMQYLGYPYVYGGASPSGFDCSGFVKYVYSQFGYALDRTAAAQSSDGVHVDRADLQPGDIICFSNGGYIGHVGIYIGGGNFIHASGSTTGVIVTNLDSSGYSGRIAECRRIV